MVATYSVRRYQSGDDEKIVSLLTASFNGWPQKDLTCAPVDHWRWKFRSGQVEDGTVVVAESGDRIIGCDHGLFSNIKIDNKIIKGRQGVDSAVHPEFRGMGVYSNLDKLKTQIGFEANIGLIFFASTNPIIVKHDAKRGSAPFPKQIRKLLRVKDVDLWVKSLRNKDNLDKQFIKYAIKAAEAYNNIRRNQVEINSVSVSDLARFDDRVDDLWNLIKDDYSFITERTKGYLNWRYRDARGGGYSVKQAVQDGKMIGYIVLRINTFAGANDGYIMDVLTRSDNFDCFEALVLEGLKFFEDANVNVVYYCGVLGHPYIKSLEKFGFLDSRNNVNVYLDIRGEGEEFTKLEKVSSQRLLLHYGDLDWM